jgi:hypothetical protein
LVCTGTFSEMTALGPDTLTWGATYGASGVMAQAEDYRRYAAECLRLAQQFRGQAQAAALLLEMAERWRGLADQAERRVQGPNEQEQPSLYCGKREPTK